LSPVVDKLKAQKPKYLSKDGRDRIIKNMSTLHGGLRKLEGEHLDWSKSLSAKEQHKLEKDLDKEMKL
jgi:hypothetical protein